MINSVCGCAGGVARPAAAHALHYDKRPRPSCHCFCWTR